MINSSPVFKYPRSIEMCIHTPFLRKVTQSNNMNVRHPYLAPTRKKPLLNANVHHDQKNNDGVEKLF